MTAAARLALRSCVRGCSRPTARAAATRRGGDRIDRGREVQGMLALMDRAAPLDRVREAFERAVDRLLATGARLRFAPAIVIIPDHFQVEERVRRDKAA